MNGAFGETRAGLRRALSTTFPAGEVVFFIPLRVVAENPARRSYGGAMSARPARAGAAGAGPRSGGANFVLVIFREWVREMVNAGAPTVSAADFSDLL